MQALEITIEPVTSLQNTHAAHFQGAFDGGVKEPLEGIEKLIMGSTEKMIVIFDFKSLDYLNSYAIGQLVAWHNHLVKKGGQLIIASPSKNVEDIFNIVGISTMLKIFPDVESAVASLSN
ncbi:STAS domain-containing protein [Candidatus Peregrinibacteria bacterium]|nr:STAS domain-containing protein [Candidatus Peregrinibacteria bacterium]